MITLTEGKRSYSLCARLSTQFISAGGRVTAHGPRQECPRFYKWRAFSLYKRLSLACCTVLSPGISTSCGLEYWGPFSIFGLGPASAVLLQVDSGRHQWWLTGCGNMGAVVPKTGCSPMTAVCSRWCSAAVTQVSGMWVSQREYPVQSNALVRSLNCHPC